MMNGIVRAAPADPCGDLIVTTQSVPPSVATCFWCDRRFRVRQSGGRAERPEEPM